MDLMLLHIVKDFDLKITEENIRERSIICSFGEFVP